MNHVLKFPAGVVAIDGDGIGRVRLSGESLAALHAQLGKVLGLSAKPATQAAQAAKRAPGQITTRKAWLAAVRGPIAAAEGKYGDRWTLIEGAAVPVRVPTHWVSLAVKVRTIRGPRDIRIPAAEFWPGGRLPGGIEVYQDPPRETRLIRTDAARERWVKAWMRVNGARLNAEAEELARKEAEWMAEDKARASEWEAHKFVTRTIDELDSEYVQIERELRVLEELLDRSAKLAREAADLFKPDFAGRIGFPGYSLTNKNANARRIKERIEALERNAGRETKETEHASGVRVVENAEANRLQLFFPDKPDAATRGALKSGGFRWAPSEGAWQRQLSNGARYAAQCVLERLAVTEGEAAA